MATKSIKFLISVCLILLMTCNFFSYAVEPTKVEATLECSIQEDIVTYIISFPENSQVAACTFEVIYNSESLTLKTVNQLDLFTSGIGQINDKEKGRIIGAFISVSPCVEAGDFVSFEFSKNSEELEYKDFELVFSEFAGADGKNIDYEIKKVDFPEKKENKNECVTNSTINDESENQTENKKEDLLGINKDDTKEPSASGETNDTADNNNLLSPTKTTEPNKKENDTTPDAEIKPTDNKNNTESNVEESTNKKENKDKQSGDYFIWIFVLLGMVIICLIVYICFKKKKGEEKKE